MGNGAGGAAPDRECQVVRLRLMRPSDMFELSHSDLFSEFRNFVTGIDFCISELRGRPSLRPVQLEISLPPEQIDDGVADRIAATLRRYCRQRMRYNSAESRAQRFLGISALRIGIPLCVIGLTCTVATSLIKPSGGVVQVIADQLGWVLVWIALWFPLDQLLYYSLTYRRENRVLRRLGEASIVLVPRQPIMLVEENPTSVGG